MEQNANESIDLRTLKTAIETTESSDFTATTVAVVPREMELEIRYSDPDGESHVGVVISAIKTGQQRVQVGQMAASLSNGAPWESLPPVTAARIWALATVTIQLQSPPDWVLKWMQEDDNLLFGLANQLEEHESTYFRGHPEQGTQNAQQPRVVVRKKNPSAYSGESGASNAA